MANGFHDQITAILPKLRIQALALTRNRTAADDLVHDAVCNALAAQQSFIPGTNFPAWMHRILRNRFISNLRKHRDTANVDDLAESALSVDATHENRLVMKDLDMAIGRLPADQRHALIMVAVHGVSYEELAASTGCAVGTSKSRVFRARRQLEFWLTGKILDRETDRAAAAEASALRRALDNGPTRSTSV